MSEQSSQVNILLVDDKPEKLLALEAVLEELGQNVVRAYSGREALRALLTQEFAVILLDVNMPGMDGFETASLIRQRASTRDVPIIFVTAFTDELHVSRGYSLGAVDYILTPVVPEVLKTKVAVFVDLYRKTEQVKRQAESLRRRATQMQKLAGAAVAINSALSMDKMLQTITDTARDLVGAHQAITLFIEEKGAAPRQSKTKAVTSFSERYGQWVGKPLRLDAIANTVVAQSRSATRLSEAELRDHPDWEIVRGLEIPPINGGMLAAPLSGRDGASLGVIYLADRYHGDFSSDDEAILVQLAQMASIAVENTIYAAERETNRIKDEFLSTLSHELRTPLNAILGWTRLLAMEKVDPEVGHGLEVIERNARAQTKLIEDLLDVSRIATGKLRLNAKPILLGPVVRAAVEAVRPMLDAKKINIDVQQLGAADVTVNGDADRLQQVVWNLLSNAAKFTPAGGKITVGLDRRSHDARLYVADTGQGIDPKFLPHVFDRFRQADSTSTRSHGGLGIGLTIVRHIVELHGGTVAADSQGEGRGSVFSVMLPVSAVAAGPEAGPGHHPGNGDAIAATDLSGVRVLLVDDEKDTREVITEVLRRAKADVIAAPGVREALEAIARELPHVLVSDIAMPDRDGYDLIRTVREMPPEAGGELPAVALTAYAREEDRIRALAAGFQAHLSKPVEPEELVATVAHLHARHSGTPARERESKPDASLASR